MLAARASLLPASLAASSISLPSTLDVIIPRLYVLAFGIISPRRLRALPREPVVFVPRVGFVRGRRSIGGVRRGDGSNRRRVRHHRHPRLRGRVRGVRLLHLLVGRDEVSLRAGRRQRRGGRRRRTREAPRPNPRERGAEAAPTRSNPDESGVGGASDSGTVVASDSRTVAGSGSVSEPSSAMARTSTDFRLRACRLRTPRAVALRRRFRRAFLGTTRRVSSSPRQRRLASENGIHPRGRRRGRGAFRGWARGFW